MPLFSRAPTVTKSMRLHGLAWKRLDDGTYIEVCDFCGGNCGQCGMTSRLGNQGFSMERMAGKTIYGIKQPRLDRVPESFGNRLGWMVSLPLLVFLVLAVAIVLLSGCTSGPAYPRSIADGGTMVGPYDITLTSHQEALGIR